MDEKLTVGSLFAGIGGFELGLERTGGFETKFQVEIDDYATRVLEKHWPDVRRWRDVRTFPPEPVADWRVDIVVGGFPCQDISYAGKGAGLSGERSGLFYEAMRVVRVLEPRIVVLENVAALLTRGMGDVLGSLALLGFDAEWHCIPAAAVGAPHIRDRVFLVGHTRSCRRSRDIGRRTVQESSDGCSDVPDPIRPECEPRARGRGVWEGNPQLPNTSVVDVERNRQARVEIPGVGQPNRATQGRFAAIQWGGDWAVEPDVGRVAHGVPKRVDRLKCLGNAVVPQVAQWIGQAILNGMGQP